MQEQNIEELFDDADDLMINKKNYTKAVNKFIFIFIDTQILRNS